MDLFIIGSELENLKGYNAQWEQVIGNVTTRYTGKISYNQNWWWSSEEYSAVLNCTWFGKLDYIGVSAFFELTTEMDPTVDELVVAWSTNPTEGGTTDKGYVVRDKPAETVLSNWYAKIAAGK